MWLRERGATRAPVGAASVPFQSLIHVRLAGGVRVCVGKMPREGYVCARVWVFATAEDLMPAVPRLPQLWSGFPENLQQEPGWLCGGGGSGEAFRGLQQDWSPSNYTLPRRCWD